ncbi:MAG TPA: hypothetical protein VM925_33865 [Labilithrix sp.]|jgi:hypothetical protein|nr:hypothetical protein [Labilithrix sp.]
MADDREKEDAEIFKVDTVPPPADTDADAYSAPTKIGEVSSATWKALVPPVAGGEHPLRPRVPSIAPTEAKPPMEGAPPKAPAAVPAAPEGPPRPDFDASGSSVPLIYNGEDEDEDGETLLHPSAKLFSLPPPTPPPPRVTPSIALPAAAAPTEPRVPDIVGPEPNDTAWPFAPALVATDAKPDRRRTVVAAIAVGVVLVVALLVWLWL